jgi:D-alanyl-D-alanine carboxypeptidase
MALAVAATLAPPTAAAATTTTATSTAPPIDRGQLQALLDAEHAAGMTGLYGEVRDGRRAVGMAAGTADLGTGRPARPGLRHRIGSVTKTFVATVVLQLVAEGKVRLDEPVRTYLPRLGADPAVTVRMLLNHTSGIGNYTDVLIAGPDEIVQAGRTTYRPEQLIAIGLGMPPTNAPGALWSYSNTNYVIVGELIRQVTGHGFEQEVRRRITVPLGLRDTYSQGSATVIRGPHARAYQRWVDGELKDFTVFNMTWGGAAGDMVSTAADVNRFHRALAGGRLLPAGQLAEMRTPTPFDPAHPEYGGYGLGLMSLPLPCGTFWGHTGGVIGQGTYTFHGADGRRQVTVGENMRDGRVELDPAHPINQARNAYLVTALCGPAQQRVAGAPVAVRQVDALP